MIDLISIDDIELIADWVELNVAFSNEQLSKAKLSTLVEDNGFEKGIDYDEDSLFDSVVQELERRQKLYGDNPPFIVDNSIVIPQVSWNTRPEYFMCLLFSYRGAANAGIGTQLFERISLVALRSYLSGNAILLGFPNEGDLPSQLDSIAADLLEDRGSTNPPTTAKDRGVDVVGWLPCLDSRKGQVIVLMQCAAGKHWNLKKRIMLDVWSQYINWNQSTTVPSLSIPEVVRQKGWSEAVIQYGIVFDRARLFKYLYKPSINIDDQLRNAIIQWCTDKLN